MNKTMLDEYDAALNAILKAHSLISAKEIAAEALEVDVDEYLLDELEMQSDDAELREFDWEEGEF